MILATLLGLIQQRFVQPATDQYQKRTIAEFKVLISPQALEAPKLLDPALQLLEHRLRQVKQEIPPKAFSQIKGVAFWIELDDPKNAAAAYHPSADWLKDNGYNVDMAKSIEIGNLSNFLKWQHIQPSMVLHELAHAYHFLILGDDKDIQAAYDHAVKSHIYEDVPFVTGGRRKAYALTNQYEYFAECSEAYFDRNDFFPFIREEFRKFDPQGFAAVEHAWGINDAGLGLPAKVGVKGSG